MNKEKRIRELEARVAYLETITQSSAHTLLTDYIYQVAEISGIPCHKVRNRNNSGWILPNFEMHCKKAIALALGISKIMDITYDMLPDAERIIDVIADVYLSRH